MNSSLLHSNQKSFEFGTVFNSNLSLLEDNNLLENSEEEQEVIDEEESATPANEVPKED